MAKKVLKKMKGGVVDQIAKDPELKAGGGAIHHPVKVTLQDRLKKKAEGGSVLREGEKNMIEDARKELKSEVKGMGPEGKAYLRMN